MKSNLRTTYTTRIIGLCFLIALMAINYKSYTNAGGAPGNYSSAPTEGNCSSCHGSATTSGSNWSNITLTSNTGTNEYLPDSVYTMTLSYSESGVSKYGFQITVLDSATSKMVGTLTTINNTVQLQSNLNNKKRDYITHKSNNWGGTWKFSWKAPSTIVGKIKFYVSIVASNSNGTDDSGDKVYTKPFLWVPSSEIPTASISVNSQSICIGDTLFATGSGNGNPTSYSWTFATAGGASPSSSTTQDQAFVFSTAGSRKLYLQTTNIKAKSLKDSLVITVNALPSISINPSKNQSICAGSTADFTASASQSNSFLWSTADTTDKVTLSQAGQYTVKVTNTSGCSAMDTVNLSVNAKPMITLSSNQAGQNLCSTDTAKFMASAGLSSYKFYVDGQLKQSGTANEFAYNAASGSYNVTVVGDTSTGCWADTSSAINVSFTAQPSAPSVSCGATTSSSLTFQWQAVSGASGYEVSDNNGQSWAAPSSGSTGLTHFMGSLGNNQSVTLKVRAAVGTPCNYSLEGSTSCTTGNCVTTSYTTTYDSSICQGSSSTINLNILNATNYSVVFNGQAASKSIQYTVSPTTDTNYPIEIIDSSQLSCPTAKFTLKVRVNALPTATLASDKANNVSCQGSNVIFTAGAGSANYIFMVGPTAVQNNNSNTFSTSTLANNDKVSVIAKTTEGCVDTSAIITFKVNPNPNVGFTVAAQSGTGYQYKFTDTTTGLVSRSWFYGDGNNSLNGNSVLTYSYLTNGSYTAKLVGTALGGCKDSATRSIVVTGVGINQVQTGELIVYPNPFTNKLMIELGNVSPSDIQNVEMIDMNGKLVMKLTSSELVGNNFQLTATDELTFGVYMLKVNTTYGILTKKVVKLSE
jgi:hypothetical protein